MVAEPEGVPRLGKLPHHELYGVVDRGCPCARRKGVVKGREPAKGLVPWGEVVGVCHYGARERKKWERGLIRRQSGVELRLYVKCWGGEEVCEKRVLSLGRFFCYFYFYFYIKSLLCLKVQKTHAALAMEIKNL